MNPSGPWPPEMVAKFGENIQTVLGELRRAQSREDAIHLLAPYDLTPEEIARAMQKVGVLNVPVDIFPSRGEVIGAARRAKKQFYIAAWRCGAAYRQIARLVGVSHQTIMASINHGRVPEPRVVSYTISDEQLAAMHREWLRNPVRDSDTLIRVFLDILSSWEVDDG